MNKKINLLAFSSLVVLSLVGCGKESQPQSNATVTNTAPNATAPSVSTSNIAIPNYSFSGPSSNFNPTSVTFSQTPASFPTSVPSVRARTEISGPDWHAQARREMNDPNGWHARARREMNDPFRIFRQQEMQELNRNIFRQLNLQMAQRFGGQVIPNEVEHAGEIVQTARRRDLHLDNPTIQQEIMGEFHRHGIVYPRERANVILDYVAPAPVAPAPAAPVVAAIQDQPALVREAEPALAVAVPVEADEVRDEDVRLGGVALRQAYDLNANSSRETYVRGIQRALPGCSDAKADKIYRHLLFGEDL